jgi:hypothetical protein
MWILFVAYSGIGGLAMTLTFFAGKVAIKPPKTE